MTALGVIVGVLLVVGGVGALIAIDYLREKKRSKALRFAASGMNFSYAEKLDPAMQTSLSHFPLFSKGHSKETHNVLAGRAGDMDVLVFDYRFTIGHGQGAHTWRQTVMLFESDQMRFPRFALRPENVFHKIGQVFGHQDIDFTSHPEFSKRYLLKGDSEPHIREIFSSEVLSFYETDRKLSTEAAGQQLIHYRARKRVEPEKFTDFIREGVQVLTLLRG